MRTEDKREVDGLSHVIRNMAKIEQIHMTEQDASTGYWRLVFSGVIDNTRNSIEDVVCQNNDGSWEIIAFF
jgi:hypothetical protein